MNKMTDKDIIKALKVCAKIETPFCCRECELGENNSSCDCVDRLLKLSLDLINRQQAELEKLNVELVGMRGACNSYKMHYDNAKAEIERLERHTEMYHELRADAIKEYMKILEEKLSQNTDISNAGYQSIIFDMEQGYKEMVGEQE